MKHVSRKTLREVGMDPKLINKLMMTLRNNTTVLAHNTTERHEVSGALNPVQAYDFDETVRALQSKRHLEQVAEFYRLIGE